jgi:hypothetical protein
MFAIVSIIGLLFLLFWIALGLLACVFWIWMLIDCLTNGGLNGTEKIVWVLVIIFLHFLGALIYFFVGRSKRT